MTTDVRDRANELSDADAVMLRLLRLDGEQAVSRAEAQSSFQTSILVSSVRCLLTYVFFPFVAPAIGIAASVSRPIGIAIALVAMVSIVISMRRFWGSRHPKRWHYTALGGVVFVFLSVGLVIDLVAVLR